MTEPPPSFDTHTLQNLEPWGPFDPRHDGWWLPAEDYWSEQDDEEMVSVVRCFQGRVWRDQALWSWDLAFQLWRLLHITPSPFGGDPLPAPPPRVDGIDPFRRPTLQWTGPDFYPVKELTEVGDTTTH